MSKFLDRAKVYRLLERELPEGVYPDGAPSAFYSTADMDSVADVAATAYANLERIYDNEFPQSADERQLDWEFKIFGRYLASGLPLQTRIDRVLAKIRNPHRMRRSDLLAIIHGIIGDSKIVRIISWNDAEGAWALGLSELSINTYLSGARMVDAVGANLCDQSPSDFGKTADQWAIMQEQAYTYQVLIYDYVLTAEERTEIVFQLNESEPARSNRVITDNLNSADMIDGDT